MKIGNHNLQQDTLAAALPLFPSAGKSNYAVAITQHLSTLIKYLKLNENLQHVGSFRIPKNIVDENNNQKPVCFRFDEALETFGSERKRVDILLLSEYLGNTSISRVNVPLIPEERYYGN
ncbi:hypothetical protein RhiirC2_788235 [Rhizophagus irregularis]|uniref:Uncharacterized protein n=1 Tax=Rhizophagus irregularis TaxID=588596 RepID=A0A2N1MQK4_9GLOM|nr:hypothetical protein RhiirC2_788235 [Rhizophagus irregularis]